MRTEIYIIDSQSPEVADRLKNPDSFSAYRAKRIMSARQGQTRLLLVSAGIAVEAGVRYFGLAEKDLVFGTTGHGKPFVEGHPEIIFNISHSGRYCAAAFVHPDEAFSTEGNAGTYPGEDYSVGIDVEQIDRMNERIASVALNDKGFADSDPQKDMCRRWTAREAFVKCIGTGLSSIREDFHFEKTPSGHIRLCQEIYDGEFILMEPKAPDGYCITVIIRKRRPDRWIGKNDTAIQLHS